LQRRWVGRSLWGIGLTASVLAGGAAQAQSTEVVAGDAGRKLVTLQGIRSATAAPDGLGFVALAYSLGPDTISVSGDDLGDRDLSAGLGFGLGDPARTVGVQVTANLLALDEGFGENGSVSVKLSRRLNTATVPSFLGLSFDGLGEWGSLGIDQTASIALTAFPQVTVSAQSYPLMLTIGVEKNLDDSSEDPRLYAGAGIGLTRNFGASLAWTGDVFTLGGALRIEGLDSMRFSASVYDVFDQEDDRSITLAASFFVSDLLGR
jgi:hypothetical protein